jgi:hypothetical protein
MWLLAASEPWEAQMGVEVASWSELGYRKLGALPGAGGGLSPAQVAERLTRDGDYEGISEHWVRRPARRKGVNFRGSIELVTVLDRDTPLDDDHLAFVEQHGQSKWTQAEAEWMQFRAGFPTLVEAVERAESAGDRWRALYRLSQALFYVGPELLRPMFRRHVAPCFFRLYPKGRIAVLRYDTGVDEAAAVMRTLYAMAQAPLPELVKEGFRGVRTLCQWHMTSLTKLMPALLDFFSYLFYPSSEESALVCTDWCSCSCWTHLSGTCSCHSPEIGLDSPPEAPASARRMLTQLRSPRMSMAPRMNVPPTTGSVTLTASALRTVCGCWTGMSNA